MTFNVGDSVAVSEVGIRLGKVVATRLDKAGRVWYLVHSAHGRYGTVGHNDRCVWADELHISKPMMKRHDPKLHHHWDHTVCES